MIDLTLTNTQARKLAKAISGAKDGDVAGIHEFLSHRLSVADAQRARLPPWRKVVSFDHHASLNGMEVLECGHKRNLRYSKNWVEDRADRRRCNQCAAG